MTNPASLADSFRPGFRFDNTPMALNVAVPLWAIAFLAGTPAAAGFWAARRRAESLRGFPVALAPA